MMKIDVNINGIESLVEAINNLAVTIAQPGKTDEENKPKETAPVKEAEDTVTMEMVRAKLAAMMQSGKQAEVKELLKKYGGDKLSDIPKDNYPALLEEAEAL